jgi:hypothetical protein
VHAPKEDKNGKIKNIFHDKLKCVFDQFLRYCIEILLGYFVAEIGRPDIFKSTVGHESLHEISNNEQVRFKDSATSKSVIEAKLFHVLIQ